MDVRLEVNADGDTLHIIKDLDLGEKVIKVLEKYYAGHAWFTNVCHQAGTVSIQLMYLGRDQQLRIWKYGYLLHINKLDSMTMEKKIMRAGGEVLERYHMARKKATENDIIDFMDKSIDTGNMVQ